MLCYLAFCSERRNITNEDRCRAARKRCGHYPQLLNKLGLDETTWLTLASRFGKDYQGVVGSLEELALFAENTGKCWIGSKNQLRRQVH